MKALQVVMLLLAAIFPDPAQPRKKFDEEAEFGLAQSMESVGQLQPIRVWKIGDKYQIEDGERRNRAAKRLGWPEMACIIVGEGPRDKGTRLRQLIANTQREDLTAYEMTMNVAEAVKEGGWSGVEAAKHLGMNAPLVSKHLSIASGPPWVLDPYREGKINFSQALEICSDRSAERQRELLTAALNGASRDELVAAKKRTAQPENGNGKPIKRLVITLPGNRTLIITGDNLTKDICLDTFKEGFVKLGKTKNADLGAIARRFRDESRDE